MIQNKIKIVIFACKDVCGDGKNPQTMDNHCGFFCPQVGPIVKALLRKNIQITAVHWQNLKNLNDCKAILGPVWGYHQIFEKFLQFLDFMENANIIMVNHQSFVRWNAIKSYLVDLFKNKIPIPETQYFVHDYPHGLKTALQQFYNKNGKCNVIIKGATDANGQTYIRIDQSNIDESSKHFEHLKFNRKGVIMQKFIPEVFKKGQFSFVYFGHKLSHFYIKVATKEQQKMKYFNGSKQFPIRNDLSDFQQKLIQIKQDLNIQLELTKVEMKHAIKQVNQLYPQLLELFKLLKIVAPLFLRIDCIFQNQKIKVMQLQGIQPYLALTEAIQNDPQNNTLQSYFEGVVKPLIYL